MAANKREETWRLMPTKWLLICGLLSIALGLKAVSLYCYWGIEQVGLSSLVVLFGLYLQRKALKQRLISIVYHNERWTIHDGLQVYPAMVLQGSTVVTRLSMVLTWRNREGRLIRRWLFCDQLDYEAYRSLAYFLRCCIPGHL